MIRSPVVALVILLLLPPGIAAAADDLPLEVRVNRAIDRAAANLVSRQAEDGSWQKEDKVHPLGRTALCGYALLHAGYAPDHVAVRKALSFLGIGDYGGWREPISTYEASCLVLLLNALGREHGRQIHEICDWLVSNFNHGVGLWGYPNGIPDLSNTQFAALALKAGERHGVSPPKKIWKRLVDSVVRLQAECGGIRYRGGSLYRATMTQAGLLVLLFAGESLDWKFPPREAREAMEKGHRWLAEHYDVERNPFGRGWHKGNYYYYMYGLERYAVFFGLEEIAGHDWYREGAEALLDRQEKSGSWGSLEETCFAILFLRRATFSEPEVRLGEPGDGDADEPKEKPRRPRPDGTVPCLREWLMAGPFLGEPGEDEMLFEMHLDPRRAKPYPDGPAGNRRWEVHLSPEDKVDLGAALSGTAWASFYAAAWVHVPERTEAVLWLGSDDGLRVWLRGEEVLFGHHHDYSGDDFYRVPVVLEKGRTLLLLHVENTEYYVHFKCRISDPDGKPLSRLAAGVSHKSPRWK